MLAQLERCCKGQAHAHEIVPPDVPRNGDILPGSIECVPEEPMGNQAPPVTTDVEFPSAIGNPYDGCWA